jgi:tRNA (guanine37-N1)-methyltransferase
MRYQVLTIFPDLIEGYLQHGILRRACEEEKIKVDSINLRDFAVTKQGTVDGSPFGGGSGMVLRPEPAVDGIEKARIQDPKAKVVLFTPRGRPLSSTYAREIIRDCENDSSGLILLCCRYEGIDERVAEHWVDYEVSLGDFVLQGGELAALGFIEATSRLLPGVLGNPESLGEESFDQDLIEYPQYTKPREYRSREVPEVLLSGNHGEIDKWRKQRSLEDTQIRRPDLYRRSSASDLPRRAELNVALIHNPVLNKKGEIVTSSITNMDLSDIARSSRTFGIDNYYIVHPTKALRRLMQKICDHWSDGYGFTYNPNRSDALDVVSLVPDFDDVVTSIEERCGCMPRIIATSARVSEKTISYPKMQSILASSEEPHLILFGTGWGIAPDLMGRADYILEPIQGFTEYNHLSVRAAAAIIFDRLLGKS